MAADPEDNPTIWEHPTLDGIPIPGTRVVRTGGGERELKIEQAQQVGYAGAFTAVRGEEMVIIGYRIECADRATRAAVVPWLAVMRMGQEKKAAGSTGQIFKPAVYRFYDPALEHNRIGSVVVHKIGGWYRPNEKSNLWAVDVSFKEWKKSVKIGGTVAPRAKTDNEKTIEDLRAQADAVKAQTASVAKSPDLLNAVLNIFK